MPNYSLIANAEFKPFSYAELAIPIQHQQELQDSLESQYDTLSSQADILEAMGQNDRDVNSGVYKRYKNFSDSLKNEADLLYTKGLTADSRLRLSQMKKDYNTQIVPIQNAWKKREQEAAMQQQAEMQNPSIMFTRDANNTSLDDYIKNPEGGFTVISGQNIAAQMASMASNLAKKIRSGDRKNVDDYTYNYITHYGLDENMINHWQDSPTLTKMMQQVLEANGVTKDALKNSSNMSSIINKSANYAQMGMWNALGEDKQQFADNYGSRMALQDYYDQKKENRQFAHQMQLATAKSSLDDGLPQVTSDGVGIQSEDGYKASGLKTLDSLKAGKQGLKKSIFGNRVDDVNPMKIYEDFLNERKKYIKTTYAPSGTGGSAPINYTDDNKAKQAILKKYGKYGISQLLSKDQYEALKSSGYSSSSKFGSNSLTPMLRNFNSSVKAYTRYSTNMADYDYTDTQINKNLSHAGYDKTFKSAGIWKINKDGSKSESVSDIDDMNLYSSDNTKGNKVNDVLYDPRYKGKIVVSYTDGSRYIMNPNLLNSNTTNLIHRMESKTKPIKDRSGNITGYTNWTPEEITTALSQSLNTYNKTKSKTSKDGEE